MSVIYTAGEARIELQPEVYKNWTERLASNTSTEQLLKTCVEYAEEQMFHKKTVGEVYEAVRKLTEGALATTAEASFVNAFSGSGSASANFKTDWGSQSKNYQEYAVDIHSKMSSRKSFESYLKNAAATDFGGLKGNEGTIPKKADVRVLNRQDFNKNLQTVFQELPERQVYSMWKSETFSVQEPDSLGNWPSADSLYATVKGKIQGEYNVLISPPGERSHGYVVVPVSIDLPLDSYEVTYVWRNVKAESKEGWDMLGNFFSFDRVSTRTNVPKQFHLQLFLLADDLPADRVTPQKVYIEADYEISRKR